MANRIPGLVMLFPGQGSQSAGMGKELALNHLVARRTFEEADEALGYPLSALCYEGPDEELRLTEKTQPAILTVSVAAARVLAEVGIAPSFVAGHSLGEYSAHVVAGTLSFADAVRTVRNRGKYMQEAVPVGVGAMAAILMLSLEKIKEACDEAVALFAGECCEPANINSSRTGGHQRQPGRGGKGRRTLQAEGRQARRHATGQRTLPLQPDAARAGSPGRGPRSPHLQRPADSRAMQRGGRTGDRGRQVARDTHPPGDRCRAVGGQHEGAHRAGRNEVCGGRPWSGADRAAAPDRQDAELRERGERGHSAKGQAAIRNINLSAVILSKQEGSPTGEPLFWLKRNYSTISSGLKPSVLSLNSTRTEQSFLRSLTLTPTTTPLAVGRGICVAMIL